MKDTAKRIIAIAGPSSTGKSELAIRLAKYLNSEIISVDSRQIYKEIKTIPPIESPIERIS